MMNYAEWVRRAVAFTESLRGLPGDVRVEVEVAPPLSEEAIQELARSCRLPIPEPLRRFWKEASGHCKCTYWWDTPEKFHPQMAVSFPNWSMSHVWGGPEFESAPSCVELADHFLAAANSMRGSHPKGARFWEYSLPIVPVGDGAYAALYVRDTTKNPPVVYLWSDGPSASGVIAPNFDAFLTLWERLGYIGIHFLNSFLNPRTGLLDPDALPTESGGVRSLLRGEVCSDLVSTPAFKTASDWATCTDPYLMLKWLDEKGRLDKQQVRRFACACCRRVWDRMGPWSRRAVDVAERFADGLASEAELESAHAALVGGERGSQLLEEMSITTENFWSTSEIDRYEKARRESAQFSELEGLMHFAAFDAVKGSWLVSWKITEHLDEPELLREKMAHADLIRQMFGNPFG
jgi:hypothetical protein